MSDPRVSNSWLIDLAIAASEILPEKKLGSLVGQKTGFVYEIGERIASNERYNLYQCLLPSGQMGVLKIAQTTEMNGGLDREAYLLSIMRKRGLELEASAVEGKRYNYHYFIPEVVESYVEPNQGNRRISVLGFAPILESGLSQLFPASKLVKIDKVRVDPRTSVWILGKIFKLMDFYHKLGISNGQIGGDNILLETDAHGIIIFDWTRAVSHAEGFVPADVVATEIRQAVELAVDLLGGDTKKWTLPDHEDLPDERYIDFLRQLASGKYTNNAGKAHRDFYKLAFEYWPRKFHNFTTIPTGE